MWQSPRRAVALAMSCTFALAGSANAASVELPSRKPGLWEIRMVHDGAKGSEDMVMRTCIDAATDKDMLEGGAALMKSMCKRQEIVQKGDTYTWDSTCSLGPIESTSHTEISGDFQSSYTMKMTGDMAGMPGLGNGKTEVNQTAKWISASCPEGFSPGDMEMPGGMKINVKDAMQMMKSFAP